MQSPAGVCHFSCLFPFLLPTGDASSVCPSPELQTHVPAAGGAPPGLCLSNHCEEGLVLFSLILNLSLAYTFIRCHENELLEKGPLSSVELL